MDRELPRTMLAMAKDCIPVTETKQKKKKEEETVVVEDVRFLDHLFFFVMLWRCGTIFLKREIERKNEKEESGTVGLDFRKQH